MTLAAGSKLGHCEILYAPCILFRMADISLSGDDRKGCVQAGRLERSKRGWD
jgi:hypothetical protein